jgi:hypothetical protein
MLEHLTNNARTWRLGSAVAVGLSMMVLVLVLDHESLGFAVAAGVVQGLVQWAVAPYVRRRAQDRLGRSRAD